MAPPMIAITSSDDPWLVYLPRPAMANVKMLDHIMELNNPTPITDHMAVFPSVQTALINKDTAIKAKTTNVLPGSDLPTRKARKLKNTSTVNGSS